MIMVSPQLCHLPTVRACASARRICFTTNMPKDYLKGFNVTGMADYVDHFNFMSYDIHGTWDGNSAWTSSDINPHTNLTGKLYP